MILCSQLFKEIHMKNFTPIHQVCVDRIKSRSTRTFRRNPGIIYQTVKRSAQTFTDYLHGINGVSRIRQVNLYMIFLTIRPWTARVKCMPRAGQYTPSLARKLLDSAMAYTAARASYEKRFSQSAPFHFQTTLNRGLAKNV